MCRFDAKLFARWIVVTLICSVATTVFAVEVTLKDGRVLEGRLGLVVGLAEIPQGLKSDGTGPLQRILFLDNELSRTFVSKRQVRYPIGQDNLSRALESFKIHQRVLHGGKTVKSVGSIAHIQPFDTFGRRTFTMNTSQGRIPVIQGITELTPHWTKVEGITHVWDLRIATSSIPLDRLKKILYRQIDPKNIDHRKKIAAFFIQSRRFEDASTELERILTDFPQDDELHEQIDPLVRRIKQLAAQRLLDELLLRRKAGQHRLVYDKLKTFPSEGVAGENLRAVREVAQQYQADNAQRQETLDKLDRLIARIEDPLLRKQIAPIRDEIVTSLNFNTLERIGAFHLASDDESLLPNERVALAISGWLTGPDAPTEGLAVALSSYQVRALIRQYLNTPDKLGQSKLLEAFRTQEAATPGTMTKIIAHMKPPLDTPPPPENLPGFYELSIPGLGASTPVKYLVQLPPEYDPLRRYPTIVTLHGAGTTAALQIDWWAGARLENGLRHGQAGRYGYIVIAPQWASPHQKDYRYSAQEHAAVLNTLRDACRRFAIDTDRVFLSGHSIGGDAVWDIGLAHPDLWAGVIPIVAKSDRYCSLYWENAKLVPYYFVCGELDGGKMVTNAINLDRYLKLGYNCTVVEYRGRGHENFSDEILRIFDWMNRFQRDFFPTEIAASLMRPWDNFFWWVELSQLPKNAMVDPDSWPPARGTQAVKVEAKLTKNNGLNITTGARKTTVWLSPEMVDFDNRVNIVVRGKRINARAPFAESNIETILEDVRTRGDRQHPFWTKIESTGTGR